VALVGAGLGAAKFARVAKKKRTRRQLKLNRWLALGALLLVALLYAKPVRSYLSARQEVGRQQAEVRALAAQKRALIERVAVSTSTDALAREARRLGYVHPGEHLYIVKGIPAWRQRHKATIGRDG
jgi:cell division protein FtsB